MAVHAESSSEDELHAQDIRVHFEGVKAVDGVDVVLGQGEILGLIGPNGAGKTTLVNALSGFQPLTSGRVSLAGVDITGWSPNRIAKHGLARTFQSVRLFRKLSVIENVELGGLGTGWTRKGARQRAWRLLGQVGLQHVPLMRAGSLPYGEERRLGLARAVAMRPRFLLLDEPAAGLNEAESAELKEAISRIRDEYNCGVLVIEHDMMLIMRLCERIQVLDYGKTISMGTPREVQSDPAVIAAYLGSKGAKIASG